MTEHPKPRPAESPRPEYVLQIRFLTNARVLYLMKERRTGASELPPDEILTALKVRLRCQNLRNHRYDIPYVVDAGHIGLIASKETGMPVMRILSLVPDGEMAEKAEQLMIRNPKSGVRILMIIVTWPDGHLEHFGYTESGRPTIVPG